MAGPLKGRLRQLENQENRKILSRGQVQGELTWDLTHIYENDAAYFKAIGELETAVAEFTARFEGRLDGAETIVAALKDYEGILIRIDRLSHYGELYVAVDRTDPVYLKNYLNLQSHLAPIHGALAFLQNEILSQDTGVIQAAADQAAGYAPFLKDLLRYKPHTLSHETEKVMATLKETFAVPFEIYETAKLADLVFPPFTAGDKEYPLSFVNFEGEYEYDPDPVVRRAAFRAFSEKLADYKYTIGTAYAAQIRNEKIESVIRRYDSVFDYLLMPHKIDRTLYDRQLDVIMEELSPHMRRYAALIKRVHGLAELHYADLKLDLDPGFEPEVSVAESREYVRNALRILGGDYEDMVNTALAERWIDFVQNQGKSTGAFCASPAGIHPYILISWTNRMREVFVLAHELGHAGQTILTRERQNYINDNLSMYAVEAPSTMNEMLMADYLMSNSSDLRFKRWVTASLIARTYFHNFVTHFLEGYFQREVYRIADQGGALRTEDFSELFKDTLEKFWGEEVVMDSGAELTWMRQPHYYMGLYPYTYSAGLTIATGVMERIRQEGQAAVDDWRHVLSMGGILDPVEFARQAGVDITTDQPLKAAVKYIGSLVEELYVLTEALEKATGL